MATRLEEVNRVSDGTVTQETTQIRANDGAVTGEEPSYVAARVIWFIAGVLLVLLAFRFVFILAGANQSNGFVNFIYSVSYPIAAPFFGIFSYSTNYGVSRVEASTLVAMAVIALVAWGLARLVTIRHPRVQ